MDRDDSTPCAAERDDVRGALSDHLCECGCGQISGFFKRSEDGHVAGQPKRFVRGHNGKLRAKPCPWSEERLWELYWKEGRTAKSLAGEAGVVSETVKRWLKGFGIAVRSNSEAHIIAWRKPENRTVFLAKRREGQQKTAQIGHHHGGVGPFSTMHPNKLRAIVRKSVEARRRNNDARKITGTSCAWCGAPLTPRTQSRVRDWMFCCGSHRSLFHVRPHDAHVYTSLVTPDVRSLGERLGWSNAEMLVACGVEVRSPGGWRRKKQAAA